MITRQARHPKPLLYRLTRQPQWIALGVLGIVACVIAIAFAWWIDTCDINALFRPLHTWQSYTSEWLRAPAPNAGWFLALGMFLLVQGITRISPQPRTWSRLLVVSILLALILRYLAWRSLATLNLSTPLNGVFSIGLFMLELIGMTTYCVKLFLTVRERDRRQEADRHAIAVKTGQFLPSVDVLIPTYNESAVILRRTIIGCQALEYPHKQIYLLDDSRRTDIQQLAAELGCHYIARPQNRHAKAGNLNYAIARTSSDLIAVFDADFIPTRNFLTRTVGFFQQSQIGMVQTHQCFYNPDPIACNLGIEDEVPHENEIFARHYQLVRDGASSTPCYGSSFLVRRDALKDVGGFVTKSVSEDLFTSIRITAQGYDVVYLDENLSAGMVPEDMVSHVAQRQRWGRGSIQAFFLKENPMFIPGLTLRQRIAYMEGVFQWFNSIIRVIFLIAPLAFIFLGILPFTGTMTDWLYFFLPLYLVELSTTSWLNYRASSALMSDVYSVATCFPIAATILHSLMRPFSKGFRVTPKGASYTNVIFQWQLALPLLMFLIFNLASLIWQIYSLVNHTGFAASARTIEYVKLGLVWNGYNLIVLGLAILSLCDIPKPALHKRIAHRYPVKLQVGDRHIHATTSQLSEIDAELILDTVDAIDYQLGPTMPVVLHFVDEALLLDATIRTIRSDANTSTLELDFERVSLVQHRHLVELVFCQPGQWQRQNAPSELRTLWLLLRSLFYPRVLREWNAIASASR